MATRIGRRIVNQSFKQLKDKLEQDNAPRGVGEMSRQFVDTVWVKFQGGRGGDGCISMLSVWCNEFAGADGGNGGNGGHVVLRAKKDVKSLNNVQRVYRGKPGADGMGKDRYGSNAEHTFVDVPIGTLVLPAVSKQHRHANPIDPDLSEIIAELDDDGSMFLAARGGAGGRGNAAFLSNVNRHPRTAEAGGIGEENTYELRMKMYAHVALIGLPNVGKSTLLKSLTGARVKIGNYAFTTLHPQVGTIKFDDYSQVAISDLPGLIEDSHRNRGMGMQFLRSLQRCACLLYVIDLSDSNVSPVAQFEQLVEELESHRAELSWRPHLVFGNKNDCEQGQSRARELRDYLATKRPNTQLIVGSSQGGEGLAELRDQLKRLHDEYQARHSDELERPLTW